VLLIRPEAFVKETTEHKGNPLLRFPRILREKAVEKKENGNRQRLACRLVFSFINGGKSSVLARRLPQVAQRRAAQVSGTVCPRPPSARFIEGFAPTRSAKYALLLRHGRFTDNGLGANLESLRSDLLSSAVNEQYDFGFTAFNCQQKSRCFSEPRQNIPQFQPVGQQGIGLPAHRLIGREPVQVGHVAAFNHFIPTADCRQLPGVVPA
jgi:hypothetical protein